MVRRRRAIGEDGEMHRRFVQALKLEAGIIAPPRSAVLGKGIAVGVLEIGGDG
jgi:hypothetical protein